MKNMRLLLPAILCLFVGVKSGAQISYTPPGHYLEHYVTMFNMPRHNVVSAYSELSRSTGLESRLIAAADLQSNGAMFVYTDSAVVNYSGNRGGDLNHQLKFDNAMIFSYNTGTSSWENYIYETQTFDALNNPLTIVEKLWNSSTSSWVNAFEDLNTYSGTNLQVTIYQSWDTLLLNWTNLDKYIYTYDGLGNQLSEVSQIWKPATSTWENSDQYLHTYNSNSKITSEINQYWDSASASWINDFKTVYTYDLTNTYVVTAVSQQWNSGTSTWDNSSQSLYTYDGLNDQLTALQQSWSGSVWLNYSLNTYSNFINQLPQTEIDKVWNTGTMTFNNSRQYTNTYNSFNQLTESISQTWNIGGFWQYSTSDQDNRDYYQSYTNGVKPLANAGNNMSVFPLPASHLLHLSLNWSSAQPFSVGIFDIRGALMANWNVPECASYKTDIPLNMPSGNYVVRIIGASESMTRQFVVEK